MRKLIKWNRRRRFNKAYMILRRAADRHRKAEHNVEFVAVDQSYIMLRCSWCPDLEV